MVLILFYFGKNKEKILKNIPVGSMNLYILALLDQKMLVDFRENDWATHFIDMVVIHSFNEPNRKFTFLINIGATLQNFQFILWILTIALHTSTIWTFRIVYFD